MTKMLQVLGKRVAENNAFQMANLFIMYDLYIFISLKVMENTPRNQEEPQLTGCR